MTYFPLPEIKTGQMLIRANGWLAEIVAINHHPEYAQLVLRNGDTETIYTPRPQCTHWNIATPDVPQLDVKALAKATDAKLAELHGARNGHLDAIAAATKRAHALLGDKGTRRQSGGTRWTEYKLTNDQVREQLASKIGVDPHDVNRADKLLSEMNQLDAAVAALDGPIAELDAIHAEHGWRRFFMVADGHIHAATYCAGGTIRVTTRVGWLPNLSGETEAEAVAAHGPLLCTHCFPSAPLEYTRGLTDEEKGYCPAPPHDKATEHRKGGHHYAVCPSCKQSTRLNQYGSLIKHKPKATKKAKGDSTEGAEK